MLRDHLRKTVSDLDLNGMEIATHSLVFDRIFNESDKSVLQAALLFAAVALLLKVRLRRQPRRRKTKRLAPLWTNMLVTTSCSATSSARIILF